MIYRCGEQCDHTQGKVCTGEMRVEIVPHAPHTEVRYGASLAGRSRYRRRAKEALEHSRRGGKDLYVELYKQESTM